MIKDGTAFAEKRGILVCSACFFNIDSTIEASFRHSAEVQKGQLRTQRQEKL
jgi:hypothetical protein